MAAAAVAGAITSCTIEAAEGLLGETFALSASFNLPEALRGATWQVRLHRSTNASHPMHLDADDTPGNAHPALNDATSSNEPFPCCLCFIQVDFVVDIAFLKHAVPLGKTEPQDLPPGPSSMSFEV